jgi:dTDP-4-amino-4,6-dideoxygalactose transaminase
VNADAPALLGGPAVRPHGPPEWPAPDEAIRLALDAAWRDGSWGKYHGGHVETLEGRLRDLNGVPHSLLCGSGTYAVELALRALKVGPGDEVILAGYDYPGNFLCVHAVGAMPVLVDLDPASWNLDPARLADALGPKSRAVLVSHLHGGLVPMTAVLAFAREHGLGVVEDACQCPGATVEGRRAGAWGDVGVLSFGGSKLLTAGRGGAILTPHADVFQRARLHQTRGNLVCPLSELQAAVLVPQIDRLDDRNALRQARVSRLVEGVRGVPGLRPLAGIPPRSVPAFYKAGFQFDAEAFGLGRDRFVAALRAEGVAFDEGFKALHVGRSRSRYRAAGPLPVAERAHRGTVILHHPLLLESEAATDEAVRAVKKVHHWREALGRDGTP